MADLDFNKLMEDIAKTRTEYGQRVADYPTFEKNLRQQVYGSDVVLPKLRAQKDQAIMELWETDKRLANRYANPESDVFIADPYKRESLVAGQHQDILGGLSAVTRMAESREDLLGDILERGVKIFELGLSAKEKEMGWLQDQFKNLLGLEQFKEEKRQAGASESMKLKELGLKEKEIQAILKGERTGTTEGERSELRARESMMKDIQNWTNFETLIRRYGNVLDPYEIRDAYNQFQSQPGRWGTARELEEEVTKWTTGTTQAAIQAQEEKKTKDIEKSQKLGQIQRAIEILKQGKAKPGPLSGLSLKTQVERGGVFGQATPEERELYYLVSDIQTGKLFEIGGKVLPAQELSRIMPIVPDLFQPTETLISQLEQVRRELENYYATTGTTGGGVQLFDPTTNQTYEYDDTSDPDYLDDLKQGWVPI